MGKSDIPMIFTDRSSQLVFEFPCKQSSGTLVKENTLKIFYLLFKQFCITVCCIFIWSECVRRQFGCSLHLQNIFCLVSIKLWKCFLKKREMFGIHCSHKKKCLFYHNINIILKHAISFRTDCILFSRPGNHFSQIFSKCENGNLHSHCVTIFSQTAK